jgi:hypothetical protein
MSESRWTVDPDIDAFLETMELPPAPFMEHLRAERMPLEKAAPTVGSPAPAFSAESLAANGAQTGEFVSLADFAGRPLALIFGSYTCPVYRGQIKRFNEIYAQLNKRLAFLLIYISEAHPEDGWQVGINHMQGVIYDQPLDSVTRAAIAADCITETKIRIPVAIDNMENTISCAYSASPERLYLIDGDGIVRYRSAMGPFRMDAIEAWCNALQG